MINSISVLFITRSPEFAGQLIGRMRYRGHAVRPKQAGNERDLDRLIRNYRFDTIVLTETDIKISLNNLMDALQRAGRSTPVVVLTDRDESQRLNDIENGAFAVVHIDYMDLAAIMILRAVEHGSLYKDLTRVRVLLQEADRRFFLMLDTSRHPVACFRQGVATYANEAWRDCFEIDLSESLDKIALQDLVVAEQQDDLMQLLNLRQDELESMEICEPLTLRTKRGRTFDADLILSTAVINGDQCTVAHISRTEDTIALDQPDQDDTAQFPYHDSTIEGAMSPDGWANPANQGSGAPSPYSPTPHTPYPPSNPGYPPQGPGPDFGAPPGGGMPPQPPPGQAAHNPYGGQYHTASGEVVPPAQNPGQATAPPPGQQGYYQQPPPGAAPPPPQAQPGAGGQQHAPAGQPAPAGHAPAQGGSPAADPLQNMNWSELPVASLQPKGRRATSAGPGGVAYATPNAGPSYGNLRSQRRLLEAINERLAHADRSNRPFALLIFALDAPPPGIGQDIEALHIQIGQQLEREFPTAATLALLENDQYAVFLAQTDRSELEQQLKQFLEAAEIHIIELGNASISGAMSCGIMLSDEAEGGVEDILAKSRRALEDARKNGGHCFKFHQSPNHRQGRPETDMMWRARIEDAMQNDRLQLLFQPLVSLHGTDIPRYSVFVRLKGADGEVFEPTEFMPSAERSGIAEPLDRWIIQHAIARLGHQLKENPNTVFFLTLSQGSLSNEAGVVEWIKRCLERYKVPPNHIVVEFKEATILTNLKAAVINSRGLKGMGIEICIGDFGNGLDPFQILRHIQAHFIKLDRGYVDNLAQDAVSQNTLSQLTQTAHDGQRQVIVPFVEDASTLAVLFGVGVNLVQGFFVHPPSEQLDYNFVQGL